jgi:hypothetical protein
MLGLGSLGEYGINYSMKYRIEGKLGDAALLEAMLS